MAGPLRGGCLLSGQATTLGKSHLRKMAVVAKSCLVLRSLVDIGETE